MLSHSPLPSPDIVWPDEKTDERENDLNSHCPGLSENLSHGLSLLGKALRSTPLGRMHAFLLGARKSSFKALTRDVSASGTFHDHVEDEDSIMLLPSRLPMPSENMVTGKIMSSRRRQRARSSHR